MENRKFKKLAKGQNKKKNKMPNKNAKVKTGVSLNRLKGLAGTRKRGAVGSKKVTQRGFPDMIIAGARHLLQDSVLAAVTLDDGHGEDRVLTTSCMKLSSLKDHLVRAHRHPERTIEETEKKVVWDAIFANHDQELYFNPKQAMIMDETALKSFYADQQLHTKFFSDRAAGLEPRAGEFINVPITLDDFIAHSISIKELVNSSEEDINVLVRAIHVHISSFSLNKYTSAVYSKPLTSLRDYNGFLSKYMSSEPANESKARASGVYTSPYRLCQTTISLVQENSNPKDKPKAEQRVVVFDGTLVDIGKRYGLNFGFKSAQPEATPKAPSATSKTAKKQHPRRVSIMSALRGQYMDAFNRVFMREFREAVEHDIKELNAADPSAKISPNVDIDLVLDNVFLKGYKIDKDSNEEVVLSDGTKVRKAEFREAGVMTWDPSKNKYDAKITKHTIVVLYFFCKKFNLDNSKRMLLDTFGERELPDRSSETIRDRIDYLEGLPSSRTVATKEVESLTPADADLRKKQQEIAKSIRSQTENNVPNRSPSIKRNASPTRMRSAATVKPDAGAASVKPDAAASVNPAGAASEKPARRTNVFKRPGTTGS